MTVRVRLRLSGLFALVLTVLLPGCADRSRLASDSVRVSVEDWALADWTDISARPGTMALLDDTFLDAKGMASDARGRLYVSDAGRNAIWYADPRPGQLLDRYLLGGPGSGQGQFMAPGGLDVDAGSILGVADTGNGRIQRFTRSGALMEIIPLEPHIPSDVRLMQTLADGTLFILTATDPFLFRMDRIREKVEPVFLDGQTKPVDIARFGNGLAVLDASGGLHILNHVGAIVRRLEGIPFVFIDPVNSGLIGRAGDALWMLNSRLEPTQRWALADSIDIRGAALVGSDMHVITRTHLHRLP